MVAEEIRFRTKLDLRAKRGSPLGDALLYLREGPMDKKEALKLAIATLFAVDGAMHRGAGKEEVYAILRDAQAAYQARVSLQKMQIPSSAAAKKTAVMQMSSTALETPSVSVDQPVGQPVGDIASLFQE